MSVSVILPDENDLCLSVNKEQLIEAQQSDCSLAKCVSAAQSASVSYLSDDGVLLCEWSPVAWMECDMVRQVVVQTSGPEFGLRSLPVQPLRYQEDV